MIFLVLISGRSLNSQEISSYDKFIFLEAPISKLGEPLSLWATYYHLPEIENGNGEIPLRNFKGEELGPKLSLEEWCKSALEGSVRIIFKNGEAKTYNYDSTTEFFENDCSSFFAYKLGKTKFRLAKGSYGDGVGKYKLTPYRTVATDPLIIPPGTVIYIPDAKGAKIKLENGETIIHDGYFFAGDGGGAIKLNHIDIFIGQHKNASFFSWVSNVSTITFQAYIVKDQSIIDALSSLHLRIH